MSSLNLDLPAFIALVQAYAPDLPLQVENGHLAYRGPGGLVVALGRLQAGVEVQLPGLRILVTDLDIAAGAIRADFTLAANDAAEPPSPSRACPGGRTSPTRKCNS